MKVEINEDDEVDTQYDADDVLHSETAFTDPEGRNK